MRVVSEEPRFGIEELAALGGVSRRTIRYYVQEGLLPPPLGLGRGDHYTRQHLDRLLEVKALQEKGLTIAQIMRGPALDRAVSEEGEMPLREAWVRVVLSPGMELHLSTDHRLPPPSRLRELAARCLEYLTRPEET